MGEVGASFSMSLDGFVAGVNDDMSRIFGWMMLGDTDVTLTTGEKELNLKVSEESAEEFQQSYVSIGAIVTGRRTFDVAEAWGGKHPMDVPIFVVTHHPPAEWVGKDSPFTFVTDGVESAVRQAQAVAGDKMVGIGSPDITRQCIQAGLLDGLQIDLVPVLLGEGIPLFKHLGVEPIELESAKVTPAKGVTHLGFRIIK